MSHSVTVLHALETKTIAVNFHASCVRMSSTTLASLTLGDATSLAPPVPVSGLSAATLANAAATCVPDLYSSVAPLSVTSPPPDLLPEENALNLLNVMVSSGRVAFLKAFLDTRRPPVAKLCLDGRNKGYDVGLILQCFLLLRESNVCVSTSAFEACNYESSSFSASSALAVLRNLPVERTRIQTLKLQHFAVNDAVMEFCCKQFPSLTCLDVGHNETLFNVPAAIQLLSGLVSLNLSNCSNLASLPDELLKLGTTLRTISVYGCDAITFPPKSICEKGKISIFNFMHKAQTAKPGFRPNMATLDVLLDRRHCWEQSINLQVFRDAKDIFLNQLPQEATRKQDFIVEPGAVTPVPLFEFELGGGIS